MRYGVCSSRVAPAALQTFGPFWLNRLKKHLTGALIADKLRLSLTVDRPVPLVGSIGFAPPGIISKEPRTYRFWALCLPRSFCKSCTGLSSGKIFMPSI